MAEDDNIWTQVREQLENTLPETRKYWLDNIDKCEVKDGTMVLYFSSDFYRDNAENACRDIIENTIMELKGEKVPLSFVTIQGGEKTRKTRT